MWRCFPKMSLTSNRLGLTNWIYEAIPGAVLTMVYALHEKWTGEGACPRIKLESCTKKHLNKYQEWHPQGLKPQCLHTY